MLYPGFLVIQPNLLQWAIMLVGGFIYLITIVLTVTLMQTERVSVVMGVLSGLVMLGISGYGHFLDYIGLILILVGVVLLLKKEFIDVRS